MADGIPCEVFAALEQATPVLVERFGAHGVVGAEYVVGFVHPYEIHVWLVTSTDDERDALRRSVPFLDQVRQVLDEVAIPWSDARLDGTVVQSEETVDRDYEGSWFYALR